MTGHLTAPAVRCLTTRRGHGGRCRSVAAHGTSRHRHAARHLAPAFLCTLGLIAAVKAEPDENRDRFGGGMAVQGGYVSLETDAGVIESGIFGLGGVLHFYIGPYVRVGGAGATLRMTYDSRGGAGSYYRVGYGGLTAELSWPLAERWRMSAGALLGMAGVDHLHITDAAGDSVSAILDEHSTFVAAPLLSGQLLLSEAMSVLMMVDWLFGPGLGDRHMLFGPKLYLGAVFRK
ncbi:MAG: hypothetical protein GF331_18310 [Chitinivibrionales bacterium]|nr:hypothetical protein [Chitinivibrionales bacterium]